MVKNDNYRLNVVTAPEQSPPADLVLVLVKSYQTDRPPRRQSRLLAAEGIVLTLQNGLGNVEKLTAVLNPERVTLGITAQGATLLQPGVVRHAGHGPTHLVQTEKTAVTLQESWPTCCKQPGWKPTWSRRRRTGLGQTGRQRRYQSAHGPAQRAQRLSGRKPHRP
jgi:ketopantoate reductase